MKLAEAKQPRTHRWNTDEYLQLGELGCFAGRRVELLDGRIIDIPPQKNSHVFSVQRTVEVLTRIFGANFWVRSQATLKLGRRGAPDPDVAVVAGAARPGNSYPTNAVLILEISDATLGYDRDRKSRTYARAAITDYWIVNLVDRRLEVFRDPTSDPLPHYRTITQFRLDESIAPLAAPDHPIAVRSLFE